MAGETGEVVKQALPVEHGTGASLQTELGQFGAGGRAMYDPRHGDRRRWDWSGDTPWSGRERYTVG